MKKFFRCREEVFTFSGRRILEDRELVVEVQPGDPNTIRIIMELGSSEVMNLLVRRVDLESMSKLEEG